MLQISCLPLTPLVAHAACCCRLAEMQAFISYKAQTTKTAGASVGPWLKSHRSKQQAPQP